MMIHTIYTYYIILNDEPKPYLHNIMMIHIIHLLNTLCRYGLGSQGHIPLEWQRMGTVFSWESSTEFDAIEM